MGTKLSDIKNFQGMKFHMINVGNYVYGKGWECFCDCSPNTKIFIKGERFKNASSKKMSCGCLKKTSGSTNPCWKGYGEVSGRIICHYKSKAKKKNLDFSISAEYLWNLFLKQNKKCVYSSLDISINETASVDRIDSSKGYIEGNVQWTHKDINRIKLDSTEDEFLHWCHLISISN